MTPLPRFAACNVNLSWASPYMQLSLSDVLWFGYLQYLGFFMHRDLSEPLALSTSLLCVVWPQRFTGTIEEELPYSYIFLCLQRQYHIEDTTKFGCQLGIDAQPT